MKKCLNIIILTLIFLLLFIITSYADDYSELWNQVDSQTLKYLEELGINEISLNSLFEVTPTRVIRFLIDLITEETQIILPGLIKIILVILISSISSAFLKESNNLIDIINTVSILMCLSFIIEPISRILTDVITGIRTSAIFINTYLPVMTSIIIASRNPTLALTYNSFSIFFSAFISNIADKIIVPVFSGMLSFGILSSVSYEKYYDKILNTIRRFIVIILSLFSTIFTGLLTTQSILSYSSDSLVIKGIRFVSGTFVPIVGSGVGDAISSVISSFVIMKNTLGVFVIAVIILINLPIMIEMLIWYFVIGLCSIISTMFGNKGLTDVFEDISSTLSLMNIVMFFITFLLVVSTGIIIVMGK